MREQHDLSEQDPRRVAPTSPSGPSLPPLNGCRACGQDFSSLETFDGHRVGSHQYTYAEGLKFDPPVEDGRRCLYPTEMTDKGWRKNDRGRWVNVARAERAREGFREVA